MTMTEDSVLQAASDPAAANAAIQAALTEPVADNAPRPEPPPDTLVPLRCGWHGADGETWDTANVRELNGADEEALSRVPGGKIWRLLQAILDRGVTHLGDTPATPALLDELTIADCDEVLLGIRRATYGDEVEFSVVCPACDDENAVKLSITDDIPRRDLLEDGRDFVVQLSAGEAEVTLPTRAVQKAVLKDDHRTVAEANTLLLSKVVTRLGGDPIIGTRGMLTLSMRDREKLVSAVAAHTPGPRLEEVKLSCANCTEDIPVPLTMADLFRL